MTTMLEAARKYANVGLAVVPLRGKRTTIGWAEYQARGAGIAEIEYWDRAGLLGNVGIVCGGVSGNLVVIDCDGLEAVAWFKAHFPEMLHTFTVKTGSGRGAHFYYRVDGACPDTVRALGVSGVGNVEFRSDGCYVVAPPSVHPDTGMVYEVETRAPILRCASLDNVRDAIRGLRPVVSASAAPHPTGAVRVSAYAQAALRNAHQAIIQASGAVNNMINIQAFKLGKLCAAGYLDRTTAESVLYAAAVESGYVARDGERAALRTISSGLNAGTSHGA